MGTEERKARELRDRRACIIAAATRVFLNRGFENATMEEIAAAAELGKGTLYLHFKSKDGLLLAVSENILDTAATRFEALPDRLSGAECVDRVMREYAAFALDHPDHFTLATNWLFDGRNAARRMSGVPAWRALLRRSHERLSDAIAKGQADGSVQNPERPTVVAAQTWGALVGLLLVSLAIGRTPDAIPAVGAREFASSGIRALMRILA